MNTCSGGLGKKNFSYSTINGNSFCALCVFKLHVRCLSLKAFKNPQQVNGDNEKWKNAFKDYSKRQQVTEDLKSNIIF